MMPCAAASPPPHSRRRFRRFAAAIAVVSVAALACCPTVTGASPSSPPPPPRRPAAAHRRRRNSSSSSSSPSESICCGFVVRGGLAPFASVVRRESLPTECGGVVPASPAPNVLSLASPPRSSRGPSLRRLSATPPPPPAAKEAAGDDSTSSTGEVEGGGADAPSSVGIELFGGEGPSSSASGETGDDVDGGGKEGAEEEVEGSSVGTTGLDDDANADPDPPFRLLSRLAVRTLVKSDLKRVECNDGASAGWTAWVDDKSASELREALESVTLSGAGGGGGGDRDGFFEAATGGDGSAAMEMDEEALEMDEDDRAEVLERRDEVQRWTRWMKMVPEPMAVDLSGELREMMDEFVTDEDLRSIDSARPDILVRAGLRLHLLPSGSSLPRPLRNPTGTMVYGKILFGGVTRFRQLSGGKFGRPRRAGERTVICGGGAEEEGWLQYGGPERNYEAVDMGPCAFLELILLATGLALPPAISSEDGDDLGVGNADDVGGTTIDSREGWNSSIMFGFRPPSGESEIAKRAGGGDAPDASEEALSDLAGGEERNERLRGSLTSAVGGLRPQVEAIVRRVLDGRAVRAAAAADVVGIEGGEGDDDSSGGGVGSDLASAMEAAELAALGLSPVRGLLLYGPPGCGKTALARELSKALHARPPKIVAAPELLDRWVGGSEKLVRSLFADAEEELRACGGDASRSALHVVVVDEIDAVFRRRTSSTEDSGEASRASAVNQILAKLDGVEQIPNVLLIGMTNRRELLDEALLRPGRLEVQVEIPLPDRAGRREILQIHFDALRRRGRLSRPLCRAIDGTSNGARAVANAENDNGGGGEDAAPPRGRKRDRVRSALGRAARTTLSSLPRRRGRGARLSDLAADGVTGGFSGADLAGLVRCAGSIALSRSRRRGDGVDGLLITMEDVADALEEVKQ